MSLTSKIEIDAELEGCPLATAFPVDEDGKHNLTDPLECWCFPDVFVYYDDDGSIRFVHAEHHWQQ